MADYTLRGPDGGTYRVTGPADLTDKQLITEVSRFIRANPYTPPAPTTSTATAVVGDVVNNVLPNWGDEIFAAGGAAKAALTGGDIGATFDAEQARFKQGQDEYDRDHPTTAWATTLGGTAASLALPAGRLASGAARGTRALHGAGVGGAYGALSGSGSGEGIADRAEGALSSGALGASMGALAAPIADGAVGFGRMLRQYVPGVDTAARTLSKVPRAVLQRFGVGQGPISTGQRAVAAADRRVGRAMTEGHIQQSPQAIGPAAPASPANILGEQERRAAMGVPAMPGDVTQEMGAITRWAAKGAGPGQTLVRKALDARKANEAARVRQHVIDTMGPVGDPILGMEQHLAASRAQAAPGYQAAYAQPMVITPDIQDIMKTPAFTDALPQAVRNIQNARRDPEALGFKMNPDGSISQQQLLSVEGFDQVIRAMRDNGRAAAQTNPITGALIHNTNSVHINTQAGDLRRQLTDQNEPYRNVTDRYADDMAQRDALVRGQDVANLTGHEINAQSRAMPNNAQEAWAIGARTAMADRASDFGTKHPTGDTADHLRKVLGDDTKQAAIGGMAGDLVMVPQLQQRLDAEHQGNALAAAVRGNSGAARQQRNADMDDEAVRSLSSFSVRGIVGAALTNIASRVAPQFRNDVKARIAQVVTETNPATVRELMAEIAQRMQSDQDFAAALHASGLLGTKAYSGNIIYENDD